MSDLLYYKVLRFLAWMLFTLSLVVFIGVALLVSETLFPGEGVATLCALVTVGLLAIVVFGVVAIILMGATALGLLALAGLMVSIRILYRSLLGGLQEGPEEASETRDWSAFLGLLAAAIVAGLLSVVGGVVIDSLVGTGSLPWVVGSVLGGLLFIPASVLGALAVVSFLGLLERQTRE